METYGKQTITQTIQKFVQKHTRKGWIETKHNKKVLALLERSNGNKEKMFVPTE